MRNAEKAMASADDETRDKAMRRYSNAEAGTSLPVVTRVARRQLPLPAVWDLTKECSIVDWGSIRWATAAC